MADSALIFDTHEDIQELVNSGMPEAQAETVVLSVAGTQSRHQGRHRGDQRQHRGDQRQHRVSGRLLGNLDTHEDIPGENHIAATNANIETLRQETKADIEALRQETKADIEALRQETKSGIAATNANIETLRQETEKLIALGKNDIIKWVLGANLGIAAMIVAAFKLL